MGRAHSNAFRKVAHFFPLEYEPVLKAASARNKEKIEALQSRLLGALTAQFTGEAQNVVERMQTGVQPYTRFVRAEGERVEKTLTTLDKLRQTISGLKARAGGI